MLQQRGAGPNPNNSDRLEVGSDPSDELAASNPDQLRQNDLFQEHFKEKLRSNSKTNSVIFNSFNQQATNSYHQQHQNLHDMQQSGNNNFSSPNQRNSQYLSRSIMSSHLYQTPQQNKQPQSSSSRLSSRPFGRQLSRSSFPDDVTMALNLNHNSNKTQAQTSRRWNSPSSKDSRGSTEIYDPLRQKLNNSHVQNQNQRERDSDEVVINDVGQKSQPCTNNTDNPNTEGSLDKPDLDTLGSLERELPVELSFLIRQQAYCIARMNYLDRQIRELKSEAQQSTAIPTTAMTACASSPPFQHSNIPQMSSRTSQRLVATNNHPAGIHLKNGNFIPSDDSGGEYSRATISDEDELSSLLDQIAKSLKPENRMTSQVNTAGNHLSGGIHLVSQQSQHHTQQMSRAHYGVLSSHIGGYQPHQPQQPQQQQQPYAFLANPNHLSPTTHQAVPVFVAMSSPIALAHHPSSGISSSILPGVHFQPEFRYNQYYEDPFIQTNNASSSSSSTMLNQQINRQYQGSAKSQQAFDTSISTLEHLVSQKEKRHIKSQLKSADNWLKMQTTGLSNTNNSDLNDVAVDSDIGAAANLSSQATSKTVV